VVIGGLYTGGLIGSLNCVSTTTCALSDVETTGPVSSSSASSATGGLVGNWDYTGVSTSILRGKAYGKVSSTNTSYLGGLVGHTTGTGSSKIFSITQSHFYGEVSLPNGVSLSGVGGIIGFAEPGTYSTVSLSDVHNSGRVSSFYNNVGGLIGAVHPLDHSNILISDSSSSGDLTGIDSVGGIIGYLENDRDGSSVTGTRVSTSGTISGHNYIGGLAGGVGVSGITAPTFTSFTDSSSTAVIYGTGSNSGGILGTLWASASFMSLTLSRVSHTIGTITSLAGNAGGFIGAAEMYDGYTTGPKTILIEKSHSSGNIYGTYGSQGGFIGYGDGTASSGGSMTVSNCYSSSNIVTGDKTGVLMGVFGVFAPGATLSIVNSYGTGSLSGSQPKGLAGSYGATRTITNSFWLKDSGGVNSTILDDTRQKTSTELQTLGTYTGWNFTMGTGVWTFLPGPFPTLQ
jgi:hypothetical protein